MAVESLLFLHLLKFFHFKSLHSVHLRVKQIKRQKRPQYLSDDLYKCVCCAALKDQFEFPRSNFLYFRGIFHSQRTFVAGSSGCSLLGGCLHFSASRVTMLAASKISKKMFKNKNKNVEYR